MTQISRQQYADLYGPTVGDKIRLGDTDLYVEIEKDLRDGYGDELQYGGGKTLRDGMGSDNQLTQEAGCLDLVITNVTIIDAMLGRHQGRRRHPRWQDRRASARRAIPRRWTA